MPLLYANVYHTMQFNWQFLSEKENIFIMNDFLFNLWLKLENPNKLHICDFPLFFFHYFNWLAQSEVLLSVSYIKLSMKKGHFPIEGDSSVFTNLIRSVLSMTLFFYGMLTVFWCGPPSLAFSFILWVCGTSAIMESFPGWVNVFSRFELSVQPKDALPIKLHVDFGFSQLGIKGWTLQINEAHVVMISFQFLQPICYITRGDLV